MAISNRPSTQVKIKVETNAAVILAQLMIAATLAVPIGMIAAAAGVAVSRSQGGQVRIAYYPVNATPTPSPSPSPSPEGTLPAPTNFQVTSVGITSIGLNWDLVPGAEGYAVYNNGVRMTVFSPNPAWINGYYLNNLASGAVYVLSVAAMGGNGADGKKTGPKTVTTQPKVNKCEKTTHVAKADERIVENCKNSTLLATCATAKVLVVKDALKVTCEDPCKRYMKPKPPSADTPQCEALTDEEVALINEIIGPDGDATGWSEASCNAWADVICKVGAPPEGAVEY